MNQQLDSKTRANTRPQQAALGGMLQRKCACGQQTIAGAECEGCGQKRNKLLQRAAANASDVQAVPPIVHDVLSAAGRPLDAATRAFMEPRFGHDFSHVPARSNLRSSGAMTVVPANDPSEHEADALARKVARSPFVEHKGAAVHNFSDVRIHTDSRAAQSAQALNARSYTVGNDIVFAEGQYNTGTSSGRELIAHELAHVVQSRANPSSQVNRALHCKRFDTNESSCTATMTYLVQLLFKNKGSDTWDAGRKTTFRSKFKQSIESTFNANSFFIKPDVATYQSGLVLKEKKSCPCATKGFKPKVQIDLVKDDTWSTKEDWEVDVLANPSGGEILSETDTSYGTLDEADTTPIEKEGSPAGVKQTPAVHEFGHFMGLHHPGKGLKGGIFSKSKLSPGADEYSHTGTDVKGRSVHGPTDLMGSGMGLRAFYFDNWKDELSSKYGSGCGWKTK